MPSEQVLQAALLRMAEDFYATGGPHLPENPALLAALYIEQAEKETPAISPDSALLLSARALVNTSPEWKGCKPSAVVEHFLAKSRGYTLFTEQASEAEILRSALHELANEHIHYVETQGSSIGTPEAIIARITNLARAKQPVLPPMPSDILSLQAEYLVFREAVTHLPEPTNLLTLARAALPPMPRASDEVITGAKLILAQLAAALKLQAEPTADDSQSIMALIHSLLWLLGLPPTEQALVRDLAAWPSDADTLTAFADWLNEHSSTQSGDQFRALIPTSHTILVFRCHTNVTADFHAVSTAASTLSAHLARHGVEVPWIVLHPGQDVSDLTPATLSALGYVPRASARLAVMQERDACAQIAESNPGSSNRERRIVEEVAHLIRQRSAPFPEFPPYQP